MRRVHNGRVRMKDLQEQRCSSEIAHSVLSDKQVERLQAVLLEDFEVHGKGNFPTLHVCLRKLIQEVRNQLQSHGVRVKATKLNGGAASHILAESENLPFSDVDLIYSVELDSDKAFDLVKDAVLDSLIEFLPNGTMKEKIGRPSLKDAYIRKMVKVDENDRWSLFALNNDIGRCVELKFVDQMRRQFEFSVDSFQIALDPLLDHKTDLIKGRKSNSPSVMSKTSSCSLHTESSLAVVEEEDEEDLEEFEGRQSPGLVVTAESMYGDFRAALRHLNERLIDTKRTEEIRGGGLLKYCHLLVRGYRAARPWKCKQQERYMCSRFFIDFPDLASQELKLCNYLDDHFGSDDAIKYEYLLLLYRVVSESTVCLMSHERRQTLAMIDRLAYQISLNMYYQQSCQSSYCGHTPRQTLLYLPRNATYWIPVV